jgi:hypothetical protein
LFGRAYHCFHLSLFPSFVAVTPNPTIAVAPAKKSDIMVVAPPEAPRTFTPASNEVAYHAPAVLEVVAPGPNASTSKKDTNGDTYVQPTNKTDDACSNNIHVPSDLICEVVSSYATKGNHLHGAIYYKCNIKIVSKSPAGPMNTNQGKVLMSIIARTAVTMQCVALALMTH